MTRHPALTVVFRDGCRCHTDGTRNPRCPVLAHRMDDDDDQP